MYYGVGRQQRVSTLSRNSFQIVQATQELTVEKKRLTIPFTMVYCHRTELVWLNQSLWQSQLILENAYRQDHCWNTATLNITLQHCKQYEEKDNSYSFLIGTRIVVHTKGWERSLDVHFMLNSKVIRATRCWKIYFPGKHGKVFYNEVERLPFWQLTHPQPKNGGIHFPMLCVHSLKLMIN